MLKISANKNIAGTALKNNSAFITYFVLFIVLLGGGYFRSCIFEHQDLISGTLDETAALLFSVEIYPPSLLTSLPETCKIESNGLLFYCATHYYINCIPSLIASIIDTYYSTSSASDYFESQQLIYCLASHEVQLLHFFPFCCSLASMFLVYFTGKRIGNLSTGILSAFFCAVSQSMLYSSSFIRFYQLNILSVCLASYFLILFINCKRHKIFFGILYALSSMACVSSMMCSIFIFPVHITYWILKKHQIKKLIPYIIWPIMFFFLLWLGDSSGLQRKADYGTIDFNTISGCITNIFGFIPRICSQIINNYSAITIPLFIFPFAIISIYCLCHYNVIHITPC